MKKPSSLPLLLCSLAIAVAVVMVGIGVMSAETGREALDLPEPIERTDPIKGSVRIPAQSAIFVDLAEGYTGVLIVDGVEIETRAIDNLGDASSSEPGQQVTSATVTIFEPGNDTLTFTPSTGAVVETLDEGLHRVSVVYWKVDEGRGKAASYTWTFNVF